MGANGLKIGQVAREAGVGIDTVRYYERKGLVAEPPRRASGYRAYPRDAIQRVRFIKRAQELGFSLREIRELLELSLSPDASCGNVRAAAECKIADIDTKMEQLRAMRRVLAQLAEACPGTGPTSECPILEVLDDTKGAANAEG